jgi:hypothetical protein
MAHPFEESINQNRSGILSEKDANLSGSHQNFSLSNYFEEIP